ncbi:MAG: hypothetical protein KGN02_03685 [bacterium]|nr:hypothetical protein [bacterium]
MRKLSWLLLPAVLISTMAVRASQPEHTEVWLTNKTGHYVYVDAIIHGILIPKHVGLVEPNERVMVRVPTSYVKVFTDIYAYVKAEHTEEASKTICTARKTFGSTAGGPPLEETVHYDGKHCWIAPT